jgi:hypothetical protein
VPQTDEEALSLLDGYAKAEAHAAVYEEWRQLATGIMAALIRTGEAAEEGRRVRAAVVVAPSAVPTLAPEALVFCGGPPYLLRIDVVGEAGHHRPVFMDQGDHARIAHQIEPVARR